jgi:hypothetical protein
LARVYRRDSSPAWVLVHFEVQGEPEAAFAERVFVYNHPLRDARGVTVASSTRASAMPRSL